MSTSLNPVSFTIFILLFALVSGLGFWASRWRKAEHDSLEEWGLGGRKMGPVVTFFLLGGDCYSATTFVAVPAAMYATGAVNGYFVVLFTALAFTFVFAVYPRLWSVSASRGYITMADYVQGRYNNRTLTLAVTVTALAGVMPFIALQLIGVQAVLSVMGLGGEGASWIAQEGPLLIGFVILAAFTYSAGLRAPTVIAFVKDGLIWILVLAAAIFVPIQLGGYDVVFAAAEAKFAGGAGSVVPMREQWSLYLTLALGQAMTMFLFPHSMTGLLAARSRNVLRRNAAIMPVYSILLGFVGLMGFMAIASGVQVENSSNAAPALFNTVFPPWFAGVAYATIAIAALVPASIMSVAAANLFTRNLYRAYINKSPSDKREAHVSKLASLFVKVGALAFILLINTDYALNLQLLGGIWILQILPTVLITLFTRWFHGWALFAGWAVAVAWGTYQAYNVTGADGQPFGGSVAPFPIFGFPSYIAVPALVLNLIVVAAVTLLLRAMRVPDGADDTRPEDYHFSGVEESVASTTTIQTVSDEKDELLDDARVPELDPR